MRQVKDPGTFLLLRRGVVCKGLELGQEPHVDTPEQFADKYKDDVFGEIKPETILVATCSGAPKVYKLPNSFDDTLGVLDQIDGGVRKIYAFDEEEYDAYLAQQPDSIALVDLTKEAVTAGS